MTSEHGRCAGETLQVQQGPIAKPLVLSPPSLALFAVLADVEPFPLESVWNRGVAGSVLRPPGVPTYLLDSTFRI